MPAKNRVKIYIKGGYYHIYNRGVAKFPIYREVQDYKIFIKYLEQAFTPQDPKLVEFDLRGRSFKAVMKPIKNFTNDIELVAYCLMPNHFHILIKQNKKESMESFMRSVITRYSQYFNKKYDRVGPVFQGRYKAVLVDNERYLLHLSRYIHLNPSEYTKDLAKAYSSYPEYLGLRQTEWVKPEIVLNYFNNPVNSEFKKANDYKKFVESYKSNDEKFLGALILE